MVPARTATGDCAFHHESRCSLHGAGGEAMLPSACRHFPRVYLRDARGDLLTLSHFCPTAASLLVPDLEVTIVEAVPPLALVEPIEGLDARNALPPLVRPGMLADISGYEAWEMAVIRTFIEARDPDAAFAKIERATEDLRRWTPAMGRLDAAVAAAFSSTVQAPAGPTVSAAFALARELTGPHPLMEVPRDFHDRMERILQRVNDGLHRMIGRYLAASTFGNWIAYRGQGLRSVVIWLRACYDVLRVQLTRALHSPGDTLDPAAALEAIRMTDYIMVHTVDSLAFGRAAVRFER